MDERERAIFLEMAAEHLGMSLEEVEALYREIEAELPKMEAAYAATRFAQMSRAEDA